MYHLIVLQFLSHHHILKYAWYPPFIINYKTENIIPVSYTHLDYDYKMLKHVRWVRNNIAHNNGGSECSENDIKYVKDFYQRIMQQKDPFSIIYQRQNEIKKRTVKQSEIKPNPYINNRKTTNKNRGYTRLAVGICLLYTSFKRRRM